MFGLGFHFISPLRLDRNGEPGQKNQAPQPQGSTSTLVASSFNSTSMSNTVEAPSPQMAPSTSQAAPHPHHHQPTTQYPTATTLQNVAAAGSSGATSLRREKPEDGEGDIVERLQAICTDANPTRLYRNLVKAGQSASGDVYTAYQVGTTVCVAIKQMDLDKQPKNDLIISEILAMRSSRHPNIVNYIDSFLHRNDVWIVMEYMEGGSLTDIVTSHLMTEGQMAAVSRETCQGLEHLHRHGVIHRDIKSDNVLLSLNGDIKLSGRHL